MQKREEWGRHVTAKRVGLVGPVKAVRATGIVGEVVFCLVMVPQDLIFLLLLLLLLLV